MTSTFAVVTDSTADIAPSIAKEHAITVVPLSVSFGTETFADGELSQAEFFSRMAAAPKLPTTSQPPVGAFVEAYGQVLERAEEVVSVHISSRLSGTIESASQAAEQFAGRVHIFDSLNLSWGLAFQVIEAARASAEGLTPTAALERLDRARDRVRMIVGVDSLDNLAKGGRIGRVSAFLGSMLNLKVTFTVDENGEFKPVARTRGEKAALAHTLDWVGGHVGGGRKVAFAVGHALSLERAQRLREALQTRFEGSDVFVYEAGIVISAHTGTGWSVAVLAEE
ncbi:MAG: DegV family protein [Actinomycetota bacterium]|nr:DegV family protein [Actinomycetota bacterium]